MLSPRTMFAPILKTEWRLSEWHPIRPNAGMGALRPCQPSSPSKAAAAVRIAPAFSVITKASRTTTRS